MRKYPILNIHNDRQHNLYHSYTLLPQLYTDNGFMIAHAFPKMHNSGVKVTRMVAGIKTSNCLAKSFSGTFLLSGMQTN